MRQEPQSAVIAEALEVLKRDERRLRTLEALRANAELELLLAAEADTSGVVPLRRDSQA